MHIKCKDCKGSKTIKGLGSIERKCPTCKGIGYVDRDDTPVVEAIAINTPRRGRPTKDKVI